MEISKVQRIATARNYRIHALMSDADHHHMEVTKKEMKIKFSFTVDLLDVREEFLAYLSAY